MKPEDVSAALVEKMAAAAHAKIVHDWGVQPPWDEITEGLRDRSRTVMRHALAECLPGIAADVLEGYTETVRVELEATAEARIDLGAEYIRGITSALEQAEGAARLLRGGGS